MTQKVEFPHQGPAESGAPAPQNLSVMREQMDAFLKLRALVLGEKIPVINATEDRLQTAAYAMNQNQAPDFYQAA